MDRLMKEFVTHSPMIGFRRATNYNPVFHFRTERRTGDIEFVANRDSGQTKEPLENW